MIAYAKRLTASKFVRNVAIVASGTAGAQAITMAFAPIITRLYGPEAFGILGTFTALLAILVPLAALSYPIAIVLPKNDSEALGLAKLSMCVAVTMSLLTSVVFILLRAPIVDVLNLYAIEPFIQLLPLAMLSSAALAVMSHWVIRKKLFKIKAKAVMLHILWLNIAKAGVGLFLPIAAVLIILATMAGALHALMLGVGVRRHSYECMSILKRSQESAMSSRALAWQYRDFAYYRTPQVMLKAISQSMPILMLTSFFGPTVAGYYALGKLVLGVPATLIGQSVSSVFYPRINDAVINKEGPYRLLMRATLLLAVLGFIPFGIVIAFGPWLFNFVFGEEWVRAGVYAQWLGLLSYFEFMNRASVATISVISLQREFLAYEILSISSLGLSLVVGFRVFEDDLSGIIIFSLVSVLLNLLLVFYVLLAAARYSRKEKPTS